MNIRGLVSDIELGGDTMWQYSGRELVDCIKGLEYRIQNLEEDVRKLKETPDDRE